MIYIDLWFIMFVKIIRRINPKLDNDGLSYAAMTLYLFSNALLLILLFVALIYNPDIHDDNTSKVLLMVAVLMIYIYYFVRYEIGGKWILIERKIDDTFTKVHRDRLIFLYVLFYLVCTLILTVVFGYNIPK